MTSIPFDPKAGEKTYYSKLSSAGIAHARKKPFSDVECGKYFADLGALLQLVMPPPRSILDLGCGTGWPSLFLARAGYQVFGVDISIDAIAIARSLAAEQGVDGVEYAVADYETFKSPREFDYVLFYDSLHHAEDERKAIFAAYQALSRDGVLFAFEPGSRHSRSPGAISAVSKYQVHEKDMPAHYIWRLGRAAGFRQRLFLPSPHKITKNIYRRDYLRKPGRFAVVLERLWGYFRIAAEVSGASTSRLTIMWK